MRILLPALLSLILCACCTTRQSNTGDLATDETRRQAPETTSSETTSPDTATPAPLHLEAVVNDEYLDRAIALVESATTSIRVVHFECNNDITINNILAALKAAAARGVQVQMLLEGDVDDNGPRVEELNAAGIQAKLDSGARYTHTKLFVVDDRRVLFGSTNLSYKSILDNNETNLYIESPAVGLYFRQYAEALWLDPEATPELTPVGEPDIGLQRVLHDGDYVPAVEPLLKLAKTRVYLLVYGLSINDRYPDSDVHKLVHLLIAAHKSGLDVRIILEKSDYNETLNEINQVGVDYLAKDCVPVRWDPIDIISHAKLLIVDDVAVVGSNNWGHGGFHLYHEVGGITDNAAAVQKLSDYFLGIWEAGADATEGCR